MKSLLSYENAHLLDSFACSKALIAFDFDGTLAPIVSQREDACMRDATATLLSELCDSYVCAVISGRAKTDVESRLGGAKVKYIIGNHGLEQGLDLEQYAHEVQTIREQLLNSLVHESGVDVEDKRYSIAVHYRAAVQKSKARAAILRAVAALPCPVRVIPGKQVVNIVSGRAPNKGDALSAITALELAERVLYVGDDITDEDVFRLKHSGELLTVRIGLSRSSAAAYFLKNQGAIDRLLAQLITLRQTLGLL